MMPDPNLHPAFQAALSPFMQTDARRKASRAYHQRRAESGLKKVTLWLSPEARETLDNAKAEYGSKDAAADAAILALNAKSPPPPEK